MKNSRRAFLGAIAPMAAAGALQAQRGSTPPVPQVEPESKAEFAKAPPVMVYRHDQRVESLLERQIVDENNPHAGGYLDTWEIASPQSGSGLIAAFTTAFLCPASRFYRSNDLLRRIALAARFLKRRQLASGNIDLLTTNLNSPPDTGFVVHNVAPAMILAMRANEPDIGAMLLPFLHEAAKAMTVGGVHTPNHRWVVSAALALMTYLERRPEYAKRVDQWLAEGIDIDEDGLYTERSPLVYSPVVNRSLIFMAEFLGKTELLDPVQRNLEAAIFLMHPNGELETGLSGRQDQNTVGSMGVNWLGLQYMAEHDGNGVFAYLARKFEGEYGDLQLWMLLKQLRGHETAPKAPEAKYSKVFRNASLQRLRRGETSVSIFSKGYDRVFSIRNGDAVVEAVRLASAFFGKGQFIPSASKSNGDTVEMSQSLSGPYYQPLDPPEKIPSDPAAWSASRQKRAQSEVGQLTQRCVVLDQGDSFALDFSVEGTENVPVAVEISLRAGMTIENVRNAPAGTDSFLSTGAPILIRSGKDTLRIEAPTSAHAYTQLRGAHAKLPGPSVYVTGFSPFHARLVFRT